MIMKLVTKRTILEILDSKDAQLMLDYYVENEEHLESWEPIREDSFFTLQNFSKMLDQNQQDFKTGSALRFTIFDENRNFVIGVCNFTNIVYGPFQACNLGYSIAEKYQGVGLMKEALEAAIDYVFNELNLHRIMANYLPSNSRSEKLLAKLGFEKEGLAKSYLKIAGRWKDHILTSKINPKHNDYQ
ncbi:ribosomal protein S5-alanine N-acetyltransferase [Francisella adeliensis]|uniref:[Ribosomal protein uS5]-alanine N-acetyltransferase n=2 Tax=Francisella adeliensis TaxID=2007306 RepID=A0A2Z4XY94_9GAMM|nr:30S ribosomal protein S5 alanine N-acetyltransferase [Francisella adeliensis]MBK2085620.1 ribosomal protein S5-alanine N-acetyltransferase [Francisella adeliensis]MBK2097498.1 ribosomal protein S5-alanine N-acetyltransferase [Francisella adeliensis]QIW11958.1 30S ribosomal protein S5 alanine N-acetyltransferase [Francisella adeliensis]QIW13834.1 30S ribosomal protein S5 alanine N-acetyltransferase [Francisella adeliensis]